MANKNSNVSYDQIPHIVINHPDTNPEHQAIMRALYKVLKDIKQCIYSNEALSKECRIPLRTVERRISELKKMLLISTIGTSYNRRVSLGKLFYTAASVADKNLTPPPKSTSQTAKIGTSDRHGGGYTKPYTNTSTKEVIFHKGCHHETTKQCHTETKGCHHDTVKGCHGDTWKDHIFKDNKKDVFSQEELQQKAWYKKNPGAKVLEKDKYLFDD